MINLGVPAWALDQIFIRTQVTLSWRDRLKLLINGGKVFVVTETNCEVSPGHVETTSTVYTPPLWKRRQKGGEVKHFTRVVAIDEDTPLAKQFLEETELPPIHTQRHERKDCPQRGSQE